MNKEDFDKYLTQRYENQRNWYSKKSNINKKVYTWFQWIVLILAAIIPVLIICEKTKLYAAGLSVILAILNGSLKTFRYQEKWINYRTVSESMKKEKQYFDAELYDYQDQNKYKIFIEKIEKLISRENVLWVNIVKKKKEEKEENVE
jgi:hypothetical protein